MRTKRHDVVMTGSEQPATADPAAGDETLLGVALERLERLDPRDERWEAELSAVSMGVVDALLAGDTRALESATDPLRDLLARLFEDEGHAREIRGWVLGLLSTTRFGAQRLPSPDDLELARDTTSWRMLQALKSGPRSSATLRTELATGPTQVSRAGRELMARGLIAQRRVGREARWEIVPRGHQVLRAAAESAQHARPDNRGGHKRGNAG